jgi:hypothetical protein
VTKQDAAEFLDLITARAPALRTAGFLRVAIEGMGYFELAPAEPPADHGEQEEEEELDALHDPATFGRRRTVPGRARRGDAT